MTAEQSDINLSAAPKLPEAGDASLFRSYVRETGQ